MQHLLFKCCKNITYDQQHIWFSIKHLNRCFKLCFYSCRIGSALHLHPPWSQSFVWHHQSHQITFKFSQIFRELEASLLSGLHPVSHLCHELYVSVGGSRKTLGFLEISNLCKSKVPLTTAQKHRLSESLIGEEKAHTVQHKYCFQV